MPTGLPRIAVYICTYRRNDSLHRAIASLADAAAAAASMAEVGVIIVDDNPDGAAKSVVEEIDTTHFALGCGYEFCGQENISAARNIGFDAAMAMGDWVAMIDDDEVVVRDWLVELLECQARTDADAVTGPVFMRYGSDAPRWLREQPLETLFEAPVRPLDSVVETASTGNSMISTAWLRANPQHRFKDSLGSLGGEDMVFYRDAIQAGLRARYAPEAVATEPVPTDRATIAYVLRRSFWMGNTTVVTNTTSKSLSRARLVRLAATTAIKVPLRMGRRLLAGSSPQLGYGMARLAYSGGLLAGVAGYRQAHP